MACICIINILNKNLGPFNDSKLDDTAVLAFQQDDCENDAAKNAHYSLTMFILKSECKAKHTDKEENIITCEAKDIQNQVSLLELASKRFIIVLVDSNIDLNQLVNIMSSFKENSIISFISDKGVRLNHNNIHFCDYSVFKNHTMWKYTLPSFVPVNYTENPFPYDSLNRRLPIIIESIVKSNTYSDTINKNLLQINEEIKNNSILPQLEEYKDDPILNDWKKYYQEYSEMISLKWMEGPFYFLEIYMYRRILDIVGYYKPDSENYGKDPFIKQKKDTFEQCKKVFLSPLILEFYKETEMNEKLFEGLCHRSLWGNQADLSLSAGAVNKEQDLSKNVILVDNTKNLYNYLQSLNGKAKICWITDNTGLEIITDLFVIYKLLTTHFVEKVIVSVKCSSLYVSDVMLPDLETALNTLSSMGDECKNISNTLRRYLLNGSLKFENELFYNDSPYCFYYMPKDLYCKYAGMDCLVLKGDANYRKLMDDRLIKYETPIESIVNYFPCPFVVLRTMKTIAGLGISIGIQEEMKKKNERWDVDGTCGLIQFVKL